MTPLTIPIPDFSYRQPTSLQFADGTDRITYLLLDPLTGLPLSDELCRELVSGAVTTLGELSARLDLDRKGKYTAEKAQLDRERRLYYDGICRAARVILADPDPALPPKNRAAAEIVDGVIAKRKKRLGTTAQGERSTELRSFFTDCDTPDLQAALKQIDLLRLYKLLQTSHNAYIAVLRKEDRLPDSTESGVKSEPNVAVPENQVNANAAKALTRELKEMIQDKLSLTFKIMAHHAESGRQPYADLLASCAAIADEINALVKTRKTRARKAAEKAEAQSEAETGTAAPKAEAGTGPSADIATTQRPATPAPTASTDGLAS